MPLIHREYWREIVGKMYAKYGTTSWTFAQLHTTFPDIDMHHFLKLKWDKMVLPAGVSTTHRVKLWKLPPSAEFVLQPRRKPKRVK